MNKRFLLFAGDDGDMPLGGWKDFVAHADRKEQLLPERDLATPRTGTFLDKDNPGQVVDRRYARIEYVFGGERYRWFQIVDAEQGKIVCEGEAGIVFMADPMGLLT